MKTVARIFFIVSFSAVSAVVLAQASIDSTDEEILRALAPEFDAELLTIDGLTEEQARRVSTTPGIGRRFEGDFNADGQQDLALFGRHSRNGSLETFVLIATRDSAGWSRAGLLEFPSDFVIGVQYPNSEYVLWAGYCTGCDVGMRVVWSGSAYELRPSPPLGVVP